MQAEKWSLLEQHIRELAIFLPQHKQMTLEQFDLEFRRKLLAIEALSQSQITLRDMYRKRCFDLCAYELDGSLILRRLRYKPLGYGGDFETIEALGKTGNSFWDAYFQSQEAIKFFKTLSPFPISPSSFPALFITPNYQKLVLDSEQAVAILEPEPTALPFIQKYVEPVRVYESLEQLEHHFGFIFAPTILHSLPVKALKKVIANLWQRLEKGGSIRFYQLYPTHSLRPFFEWCLDWNLYYHSESILKSIGQSLGADSTLELKGEWWKLDMYKGGL